MTGSVDLNPNHLGTVKAILAEHVPECEVRAFGSRATWTAKDYSDLDLAVVGEGPLHWRTLDRLKEAFEESDLPMRVDVLDWHAISDSFRKIVERDYVILREEGTTHTLAPRWSTVSWGDLATLEYGKSLRGYDTSTGNYRVYGTNGPIGWNSEPLCPHASVIVGRKGAYRGVHYSPDPFFVIDTAFYLKPKVELDTRWAYYQLLTQDINGMDSGSAIPSTSREDFYGLPVEVPPLAEQRVIAHVLGTLDDKIELNRRMNETLEGMARALFKSWFVDFEPVRAKMEGRWRRGESLPGLPAELYDLFPGRLVGSEVGEVPEGWEVGTFGDIVTRFRENENPATSPDTIFSHFSIPAYDEGKIPKRELSGSIKSAKSRVPQDAVLLSKLNPEIERVWLVDVTPNERAICSTEFLVLEAKPPFRSSYVYCLALSPFFRQQVESLVTGTSKSHQRAPANTILALPVLMSHARVVETFEMSASELLRRSMTLRRESLALATQRDVLLPGLVSGEVGVPV